MGRKVKYGHHPIMFGGESNGRCKYSDELVNQIKEDREKNKMTYKQLETKYNISWQSMYGIINRRIPTGIYTYKPEDKNET